MNKFWKMPLCLLPFFFCSFTSCRSDLLQVSDRPDLAELAFTRVNEQRVASRLSPLQWQDSIAEAAREHSVRMAEGTVAFGHDGFQERIEQLRAGFTFTTAAENVGYCTDQGDPVEVIVNGWMQKADHRANILGDFNVSGVGAAEGKNGEIYITQLFLNTD